MTTQTVLLICGAIAGPLFVIVFLAQSTTRSEYDWVRQPISALALGRLGWMQKTNFVITGLLMLALATGLYTVVRPAGIAIATSLLIGVYAIGLIGAGIFVTAPVGDYRPDSPAQSSPNVHGALHGWFSMVVFIALPAACFVLARGFAITASPGWAIYSGVTGALFIAGFVLTSIGFAGAMGHSRVSRLVNVAGLLQRLTIILGWGWLSLVAIHLLMTR